ncbi:unannotated protein [freshwater metagenome]|uniref:Unannotated protein n=1 Tax=freshwater metagenome TaxID=449393 RepID=A0A6J7CJU0_9ZZZZ
MTSRGLLGGTFNPPHVGHLALARAALAGLGLDSVALVPVRTPPHKPLPDDPGPELRLELCRLAVRDEPGIGVLDLEIARPGPSYTVDTLRTLHECDPSDELTFIVGADVAAGLHDWREPREVLRLARLAVVGRGGIGDSQLRERLTDLHDGTRIIFFEMTAIDVSSTLVRERIAAGSGAVGLMPEAVAARVSELDLYRDGDA